MLLRRFSRLKLLYKIGILLYFSLYLFSFFNYKSRVHHIFPEHMFKSSNSSHCILPSHLGPVKVDMFSKIDEKMIIEENKELKIGGLWAPKNCKSWQKVAIIIPYRDRQDHLMRLLHRLHPMLQQQMSNYQVFVVEQTGTGKLNKGKLLNIGVLEAINEETTHKTNERMQRKVGGKIEGQNMGGGVNNNGGGGGNGSSGNGSGKFDCFVLHDVDLLAEDDRNIYYCTPHVHHLISALDEMRYHIMYYNNMGGALSINRENIFKVNGHSNSYWGWGNEDDDFNARTEAAGLLLTRPLNHIGRFKMARHPKKWRQSNSNGLFLSWKSRWMEDGIKQTVNINNINNNKTDKNFVENNNHLNNKSLNFNNNLNNNINNNINNNLNNNINNNLNNNINHNINNNAYKLVHRTYTPLYTHVMVDVGVSPEVEGILEGEKESLWWYLNYFFP